jgi:hypothetical protein
MKKFLIAVSLGAILALIALPVGAGTLYQQEGTSEDGTPGINASGQGPASDDSNNWTNWKYQYGSGSWSGVYAGEEGWMTASEDGDMTLEVEADVEMYFTETVSNNKIYFHLGNIYSATTADKTAFVQGTFSTNNGQYIGISFTGTGKDESSFEKDGSGDYTGVILDGMQSDRDTYRTQDNQMDLQILLNWGAGWQPPVAYGDGAHSTIHDTLWWLVNGGAPGTYNYQWRIRLLPTTHQPDGDYYLDPVIVACPVL